VLECPRSLPVRGVAPAAPRRGCLPSASTPEDSFCAVARVASVVVLARHSALGRSREIADLARTDIRRRYQFLRSPAIALCAGTTHPVTSLLAKVACALNQAHAGHVQHLERRFADEVRDLG
jgi:hypothetical protein